VGFSKLSDLCEARRVKSVAIIDDVFDVPDSRLLDANNYSEFKHRFDTDEALRKSVAWVSGTDLSELPVFEDITDDKVEPLWQSFWKPKFGGRKPQQIFRNALSQLFDGHTHDVLSALTEVEDLYKFLCDELKVEVDVYGRYFDPIQVSRRQIVAIDFFLEHNLTAEEAYQQTTEKVQAIVSAAISAQQSVPSFLLISSRPEKVLLQDFPKQSNVMASRFGFFPKKSLKLEDIPEVARLYDLIETSNITDWLEQLLRDWKKKAKITIKEILSDMFSLDVTDFVYLDYFRLNHEGTTVSEYLRWFLTSYCTAKIPHYLEKETWRSNKSRLFEESSDSDGLNSVSSMLIKTFAGPSDTLALAYSEIVFDQTRSNDTPGLSDSNKCDDVLEGDLFINLIDGVQDSEVRLVLTPGCDLRVRPEASKPKVVHVLFLVGIVKHVDSLKHELDKGTVIPIKHGEKVHFWGIEWKFEKPLSITYKKVIESNTEDGFFRLGRFRELYFHRIRDKFVQNLSRIGTEVAPLLPKAQSGKVSVLPEKRDPLCVLHFDESEKLVWVIENARIPGTKRKKTVYLATPEFWNKLNSYLEVLINNDNNDEPLERSLVKARQVLNDFESYEDLLSPMADELRGAQKSICFKTTASSKFPKNAKIVIEIEMMSIKQ